jgi:hypothetical protein
VLASLAREGSPVHRVQWVASSYPDEGRGVRSYLAERADADPDSSACLASYESLLDDMDTYACSHDVVLALQVRLTKSVETGCAALAREMGSLVRLLGDADVEIEAVLSPDDLARLLLRTYEPSGVATSVADPWPMAVEERWSSVRVDAMVHATYWVAEWPRIEVRSDFLAPVLLGSARAAFSVVMEPLGPEQAVRKVEASRAARPSWPRAMRRSGTRASSRCPRRPTKSSQSRATPCSMRRGRAGSPCAACTGTRPPRTRAHCRCAGGWPDRLRR